jgi:hypothetical protein
MKKVKRTRNLFPIIIQISNPHVKSSNAKILPISGWEIGITPDFLKGLLSRRRRHERGELPPKFIAVKGLASTPFVFRPQYGSAQSLCHTCNFEPHPINSVRHSNEVAAKDCQHATPERRRRIPQICMIDWLRGRLTHVPTNPHHVHAVFA